MNDNKNLIAIYCIDPECLKSHGSKREFRDILYNRLFGDFDGKVTLPESSSPNGALIVNAIVDKLGAKIKVYKTLNGFHRNIQCLFTTMTKRWVT